MSFKNLTYNCRASPCPKGWRWFMTLWGAPFGELPLTHGPDFRPCLPLPFLRGLQKMCSLASATMVASPPQQFWKMGVAMCCCVESHFRYGHPAFWGPLELIPWTREPLPMPDSLRVSHDSRHRCKRSESKHLDGCLCRATLFFAGAMGKSLVSCRNIDGWVRHYGEWPRHCPVLVIKGLHRQWCVQSAHGELHSK